MKYGWIEPGEPPGQRDGLFGVRGFRENPSFETARKFRLNQDSVWNTFVMVGRVTSFSVDVHAALPERTTDLDTAPLWKGDETHIGP